MPADKAHRRTIDRIFASASEQDKIAFLKMIHHRFENFLSLVVQKLPNDPAAVEDALEATLQRKGIVLDALSQERQRLLRTEKPEVIETMEQLRQITTQLSALTLAGPGKQAVEVYRNRLAQLQTEMEQLEKALGQQSQAFRAGQQGRLVKAEGVAHALKSDQALIEYISFRNSDYYGNRCGSISVCNPANGTV